MRSRFPTSSTLLAAAFVAALAAAPATADDAPPAAPDILLSIYANTEDGQAAAAEVFDGANRAHAPATFRLAKDGRYLFAVFPKTPGLSPVLLPVKADWTGSREMTATLRKDATEFDLGGGETLRMRWCPAGKFTMGSPVDEAGRSADERRFDVQLTHGFWIGETEVTQGQWERVMGTTLLDQAREALADTEAHDYGDGRGKVTILEHLGIGGDAEDVRAEDWTGEADPECPMYYVNLADASAFCQRLTQILQSAGQLPVRMQATVPTEAQWEYACRAGTLSPLPTGEGIDTDAPLASAALDEIAWYAGNSSRDYSGRGWNTALWTGKRPQAGLAAPRLVASLEPNEWGLYDMLGNVAEWTRTWYATYPQASPSRDPAGPITGLQRCVRGGSWRSSAEFCRSAARRRADPMVRDNNLGFRVVITPAGR